MLRSDLRRILALILSFTNAQLATSFSLPISNPKLQERNDYPVWTLQQTYQGGSFFDEWEFWSAPDPTNGIVDYKNAGDSWGSGLVYVRKDGQVVMQADSWSDLPLNRGRPSVRIHSHRLITLPSLIILDITHLPTGCASWPAFWLCGPDWPYGGEIDVVEAVNGGTKNQMTLHTGPGCRLTSPGVFSGQTLEKDCDSTKGDNCGCGIMSNADNTVGPGFNDQGGGVYVVNWLEDGIYIWNFKRWEVPGDILDWTQIPEPRSWRQPDAAFAASGCDPFRHFTEMQMIFDTTFCGDWAGSPRAWSSSGCPGTCAETVRKADNFKDAFWTISSLRVFGPPGANDTLTNGTYGTPNHDGSGSGDPKEGQGSGGGWTSWATSGASSMRSEKLMMSGRHLSCIVLIVMVATVSYV